MISFRIEAMLQLSKFPIFLISKLSEAGRNLQVQFHEEEEF